MPAPFQPATLYDFLTSFGGGVNEGDSPLDIEKNVMAGAVNTTVRGKYVTHRPAYQKRSIAYSNVAGQISPTQQAVEQGYFQGACFDAVDDFGNASAVALISQRLFQFSIAGSTIICMEILIPGGPTYPVPMPVQAWLWQAERWVIVQDGVSQPIFLDLNTGTATRASGTAPSPQASAYSTAGIAANGAGSAFFSSVVNLATGRVITTTFGEYTVGTINLTTREVALTSYGPTTHWPAGSAPTPYAVTWTYNTTSNYSGTAGSPAGIAANGIGSIVFDSAPTLGPGDILSVAGIGTGTDNFSVTGVSGMTVSLKNQTADPWPQSSFPVSWTWTGTTQHTSLMRGMTAGQLKLQTLPGLTTGSIVTVAAYGSWAGGTFLITNANPGGGVQYASLQSGTWPPASAGYIYTATWYEGGTVTGTAYSTPGIAAGGSGPVIFSTTSNLSSATNGIVNVTLPGGIYQVTVGSVIENSATLTMPTLVAWPAYAYSITWTHTTSGAGSSSATSSNGVPPQPGTGSAIFDSTTNLAVNTVVSTSLGNYLVTAINGSSVSLESKTGNAWPAAAGNYDVSWPNTNAYSASAQSTGIIAAGQTGTAIFDSVINLKVGSAVIVGGSTVGACQVTAINGSIVSLTNQSSNSWASGTNYTVTWTNTIKQIPPGRMGAYGMGRNWITLPDGLHFVGSDIVNGASGTAPFNFRDSVLAMEENTYIVGGGAFVIPASGGETIKAMRFLTTLDASLGQGPLQVFTNRRVFSCNAPVDRLTWQSITNPILTESLIHNGALGQNSTVLANSDVLFRDYDGVRSLILARQEDNTWGRSPISFEVGPRLYEDDKNLLNFSSVAAFDNRWLLTAGPVQDAQGVYFQGLVPLNFDPTSSLRGKAPSVWDAGVWTGLNILQLGVGVVEKVERAFAFVLSTVTVPPEPVITLTEIHAVHVNYWQTHSLVPGKKYYWNPGTSGGTLNVGQWYAAGSIMGMLTSQLTQAGTFTASNGSAMVVGATGESTVQLVIQSPSKRIEFWEILPSDGPLSAIADNDGVNDIPITWRFDSAALRFGVNRDDRKYMSLSNGEIWVDELSGIVSFNIQYRPDQYPIWTPWRNWQVCQTVDSTISQPGFNPRMGLGEPSPQPCDLSTNRPMRNGFTFQTRNIIQGHCVFLGAFYEAQVQPMPKFAPIACGALCLNPNFLPNALMGQLVSYTFGTPPNPLDVGLTAIAYDPNGILPTMGWNPDTKTWK